MAEEQSNIKQEYNIARAGMNLDNSVNEIPKGQISYGLNAVVENWDANSTSYQNELGNQLCLNFPDGYLLIGSHFIPEQSKHIFFLVNPETQSSEIGHMDNNDCIYHKYINSSCLNFSINHPIHKAVHKITNCTTEVYWTDGFNPRRYIDLNNLPFLVEPGSNVCDNVVTDQIDCNKLNIQPNFNIPELEVVDIISGGNNISGTYQFAIQYSNANGDGYTSYYSVTNPTPIANIQITTPDFNYPVGKSIVLNISNIDTTGYFKYFNIAVIKTINAITSVELVGTYFIDNSTHQITYSGQNVTQTKLTTNDIFEKFPYYDVADDLTAVQDILVWKGLSSIDRINYQLIANKITLQWQTWRIPAIESYADELNATNLRGYLRDEIYPFEIVFLLKNGKQTDGFHIPGRAISFSELSQSDVPNTNPDFIGDGTSAPYWKIYNTGSILGTDAGYTTDSSYKGPYQYGEFAYWESTELYPCNEEVWGELANTPIRHHKFPDVRVSPIFESGTPDIESDGTYSGLTMDKRAIYPIGIRVDSSQVEQLILQSSLSAEEKSKIVGFKIVRGDRNTNKSIIAKGILRNVGKYSREGTDYYFPNYPYNDLREDPFLLERTNAYSSQCILYKITFTATGDYQYTDCFTNSLASGTGAALDEIEVCSITLPTLSPPDSGTIEPLVYDTYILSAYGGSGLTPFIEYSFVDYKTGDNTFGAINTGESVTLQVEVGSSVTITFVGQEMKYTLSQSDSSANNTCYPNQLDAFTTDASKYRNVFNSPETSFGQPYLGDTLKLENVLYGTGKAHFVEVKKNALYKLITKEAQEDALQSSEALAAISVDFNSTAMFTAYQSYLQIYINGITRKNYGWSYNSILDYGYSANINNNLGVKQRKLDISQYLISGVQSLGDNLNINNWQRESSVYLKTTSDYTPLPYPSQTPSLVLGSGTSVIEDKSRYINSQKNCAVPEDQFDISSVLYYASIKNIFLNQWGQIYSYETIDTGTQVLFSENRSTVDVFGGDTFISRFSFKIKLPFFIDNRVNAPDDSDIFYDEIGNVAYPKFWHSSRSILYDYVGTTSGQLQNIISIKAHNLDCPNSQLPKPCNEDTPADQGGPCDPPIVNPGRTFYDGKMYMFAYGIPTFYVESSINVDLRQAFNNKEGDFYPHVSSGIPDDWVQQSFVPIVQDNTYYYNVTYSKQNKENYFSHLPTNWIPDSCLTTYPFRGIYSDPQQSFTDNKINSWLIYRPSAYFDFPQNYGKFTSIDGIENKQVLARFENKSLLYNVLYTNTINTGGQVYLGQPLFSRDTIPLDFAETNLGYVGSQHKFLLKIPQGQVTVDAKRGQVFLVSNSSVKDISGFRSGVNRFLTDHLSFEILNYFPTIDIDNNFNGIGLHGVYDSKFDRVIISKLDYIPLSTEVLYDNTTNEFYINKVIGDKHIKTIIYLSDSSYFCNKSWTLSFNLNTQSWTSFHSYIPNWYIAENNFFYSGLNESCELDIIAAEIVPPPTTTTTSSTTTIPPDCEMVGTAVVVY